MFIFFLFIGLFEYLVEVVVQERGETLIQPVPITVPIVQPIPSHIQIPEITVQPITTSAQIPRITVQPIANP